MYIARRKNARPPWIRSLPCHRPDWRDIGANPARHAACLPFMVPSSGISISIEKAVTFEIPGNAGQDFVLCDQLFIIGQQFHDGLINLLEMLLDLSQSLFQMPFQQRLCGRLHPCFHRHTIFDQPASGSHHLSENVQMFEFWGIAPSCKTAPILVKTAASTLSVLAIFPVASANRRA